MTKSRLDFFIIFSHGLPYAADILGMIRQTKTLEILYIKKTIVNNMGDFVKNLYACDTVPYEHLEGKTRYLLTTSPEFLFILVNNSMPDERFFGEGYFRHIQCCTIKEVKQVIRDRYNPRKIDHNGSSQIVYPGDPKFPAGERTEHHVIHGSDYETQTFYALNLLGLPDPGYFTRVVNPDFNAPYFLQPFERYCIKEISFDQLLVRNGQEYVHVADSLHYQYLYGNRKPYLEYLEKSLGITDFSDHSHETFDVLFSNFHYDVENYIICSELDNSIKYLTEDGNHRAAILYYQGKRKINVAVKTPFEKNLQLKEFFKRVEDCCVVLRRKEWLPNYYAGEDLDLLTDNYEQLVSHIIAFANLYDVKTTIQKHGRHYHLDIYFNPDQLHFRFDIVTTLEKDSVRVNPEYTSVVLGRTMKIEREGVVMRVPNPMDELIIRYLEFTAHPTKTKHKQYIDRYMTKDFYKELTNNVSPNGYL
jgi:hypothetical protein